MGFVLEGTDSFGHVGRLDGWQPGRTSRDVTVACCPSCGSSEINHKGAREPGASLVYWQCTSCRARWKSADRKEARAIVIR